MSDFEIEVTLPLTVRIRHYRHGNRRLDESDELDYDLSMPGGQQVDSNDLGLHDEDIDSLVWEQIDRMEKDDAA